MKIDKIILNMVPGDVQAVMAIVIRDHLACECVDRRDIEEHAEHLAEKVVETLTPMVDESGEEDLADFVLKQGRYAQS